MTPHEREAWLTARLVALPRDLRRDPYGYDLSGADLAGWAAFMIAHQEEVWAQGDEFDPELLIQRMAEENTVDMWGAETAKVGSGIEELAEEDHFRYWVDEMVGL